MVPIGHRPTVHSGGKVNKDLIPNIIIGVPTGSSASDATVGFAKASRRVKKLADESPFTMDELTSALAVLEKTDSPGRNVRLCVPADAAAVPTSIQVALGERMITDPQEIVDAATGSDSVDGPVPKPTLADAHMMLAVANLFSWDWDKALDHARSVLRYSVEERLRDEALNISGIALYLMGHGDEAATALRKAVEGEWNIRLRTNLAALVMHTNPAEAAAEMAYLVGGAGSSDDKLEAARNAVRLWRMSRPDGQDDEDAAGTVPDSLRQSLRSLIMSDISEEDFWDIGQFIAHTDSAWVKENAFLTSRHCDSDSACLLRVRTVSFEAFLHELSRRGKKGASEWIFDSAEEFVAAANGGLIKDFSSNGHASFALECLKAGLDASTQSRILLRILLVFAMEAILDDGDEPVDEVIGWLKTGRDSIGIVVTDSEQKKFLTEQVGAAYDTLGRMYGVSRENMAGDYRTVAIRISEQMNTAYGRRTANMTVIKDACRDIRKWANDTIRIMAMITPNVANQELKKALNEFVDTVKALKEFSDQYV